jgi:hypothetical protein
MEADIMRRLIISGIIILTVFIYTMTISGQPSAGSKQEQSKQLEKIREQWPNMSEQERAKMRSDVRSRVGSRALSLEVQLQAVKKIEEQVTKLKSALESMIEIRKQYQNMTDKQREKIGELSITRQQATAEIENQLEKLRFRGQRLSVEEPQMRLQELQEIQQLAVKEKASETAKKLENFIASYHNKQAQTQAVMRKIREEQETRIPRKQGNAESRKEQ